MAARFTDAHFRNKKPGDKPYKVRDSNGLYLLVQPSGSRLWRYRYRINGRENVYALGDYGQMSLQEAREARDAARKLVKEGVHPSRHRKATRLIAAGHAANTFEAVAREWIDQNRARWSPGYLHQVETTLAEEVFSKIGGLPMRDVKAAHLLSIVKKVASHPAPAVAVLIRQWCSSIFRYAVATLRAEHDPAAALKGAVTKPKTEHKRPLPQGELPLLFSRIKACGGTIPVKIALKLLLLTFVRPGELRMASWNEFDLDQAIWRIPKERMKMREEHVVPLSAQAIDLLKELHSLTGHRGFLFPNVRDPQQAMSPTTLNRSLERMGYAGIFSAHGFRATASTLLNEMDYKPDVIERQLAHQERSKSRRSYNQAAYTKERKKMMQDWANFLDAQVTDPGKVVAIRGRLAGESAIERVS